MWIKLKTEELQKLNGGEKYESIINILEVLIQKILLK